MSNNVVIYGAGPFAELMHEHFTHDSDYDVVAFCVDKDYLTTPELCGLPLVDVDRVVELYPPAEFNMFVAIGYKRMRNRSLLFHKAKRLGYKLVNFISRRAHIRDDLIIGENNAILSSCDFEPSVKIGDNNVFWTRTIIGHNATVGDHNYISGGGGIGGNCSIGNYCFLGNGALMINDLAIRDETYMVAGTVILRDTEVASKYHGNPSKLIGHHAETGIVIL